jgi:hypothetical protein
MTWQTIRLELAGTREFPTGSAGQAFLLRLPLCDDGSIDEAEVALRPSRATVRRFWASEPDSYGPIVRCPGGWECRCVLRGGETLCYRLAAQPFRPGGEIMMTDPEGRALPFRVAGMTSLG